MGRRRSARPMPWLRQRLRAVNATSADLARHLRIPPARVYEMIKGQRQFQPHEIAAAASFLKIGEGQFRRLIDGDIAAEEVSIDGEAAVPWADRNGLAVPMLRATLGPHGRWLLHVADSVGALARPDFIRFSMTAFAIVVQDDRNNPVYRARDRILVDPETPVSPGDDVVLSTGSVAPSPAFPQLILGQLTKANETAWSLKQYGNGYERPFPIVQFRNAWKIVSRFMSL